MSLTEEITCVVFSLSNDNASKPYGFGASFFHYNWDIIKQDISEAVIQFFFSGWILPSFNSNTLVLILKSSNVDSLDQFCPIVLSNFNFKIISKIIADGLSPLMSHLVSLKQRGFV